MANTFNPRGTGNNEGFNPRVDNSDYNARASGLGKFFIYISFIFIFPIFIYIGARNTLLRLQNQINEATSGIDVQLKRRRDTLIKLIDATKGVMKFEQDTFREITQLRTNNNPATLNSANQKLDRAFGMFNAQLENYPNLKSSEAVGKLMDTATGVESEIAATRRLYNAYVREFNQRLYTYPSNVIANDMRLSKLPYFEASATDRQDVEVKFN